MMSSDEGLSILRKMHEESSRIYVTFVEHGKEERFSCKVQAVTADGLALSKYEVGSLLFNLEGAEFEYSEPREADAPEVAAARFEFVLLLSWANGARCRLFVLRDDFDPIKSI